MVRGNGVSFHTKLSSISKDCSVFILYKHTQIGANAASWCNTFMGVIASAVAVSIVLGLSGTQVMMSYNICTTFVFVLAHQEYS